ncbi:hypothetical protein [Candidatus Leptofilum sp.]|uniref:hypothetical protein n=1 Tax=Candidatus Leptofilum sp. TaxID=3241576 RepID=UPI003B5AB084
MIGLMEPIRLIIIDQHTGVRSALRIRLRSASGINIVASVDADEALQLAPGDFSPDVAVLGLTGRNDELKKMVALVEQLVEGGTAVLALSSYIDVVARELVLAAGASDYRLKNINTPELIAEIRLLAESHHQEWQDNH